MSEGGTTNKDCGSLGMGPFLILRFESTNTFFETIEIDTVNGGSIGHTRFSLGGLSF